MVNIKDINLLSIFLQRSDFKLVSCKNPKQKIRIERQKILHSVGLVLCASSTLQFFLFFEIVLCIDFS